jgi:hypothetical protein
VLTPSLLMLFFSLGKLCDEFLFVFSLTALSLVHSRAREPLLRQDAVSVLALPCLSVAPPPSPAKAAMDRPTRDARPGLDRSVPIWLDLI